jgi:radical SAM superfamily enzyme YgiQ (UPF0313 family)
MSAPADAVAATEAAADRGSTPRQGERRTLRVVLISTYELGRQPFGVASAAAWLERAGASVTCFDLAVEEMNEGSVVAADLVAFYVPMHTATRLAVAAAERVKSINPDAHLCFFGLYAPMNEAFLRRLGARTILGGEFEEGLVVLVERLATGPAMYEQDLRREPLVSLGRQQFLVPDRAGLPRLGRYAFVTLASGERRTVGYTEASRGCKHTCRHCPVVPVYGGRFRIVPRDVVMEDIRRQLAASAQHITFGDPDFFNGIGHAIPLVRALHHEFPDLTYDVTVKVEHLLRHAEHIRTLRETGCLFVTSAAEAIDDTVLAIFDKGHTREQFIQVASLVRDSGLALCPTFVAFTPWTSLAGYRDLLSLVAEQGLIDNLPPVQLAVRLLIPAGSRLLDLPEVQTLVGAFDDAALSYRWTHPDPRVDKHVVDVTAAVQEGLRTNASRHDTFERVWSLTHAALRLPTPTLPRSIGRPAVTAPRVSEPWFC